MALQKPAITANAERREAVILNAELRNFTRFSEMLPPDKVLELANDFFSLCGMAITANADPCPPVPDLVSSARRSRFLAVMRKRR